MKILVIEDDRGLVDLLSEVLTNHHYNVEVAYDGQAGLALATSFSYDLILLDWGLPILDGMSLCQQLRAAGSATPVLLMTVEGAQPAKVQALDAGADDYLVKPIDPAELLARIRALLRRGQGQSSPVLAWGPIRLDPATCEVSCAGHSLSLTAKEYELLELFLRHPQQIFNPDQLIDQLWSLGTTPTHNAVRARIKSLRDKLHTVDAVPIETVHGMGYRLAEAPASNTGAEASEPGVESDLNYTLAPIWER
ncbi:MAG: response regulator transcription factor, partial [Cyanobacteria bacterium P01_F01_bin.4]